MTDPLKQVLLSLIQRLDDIGREFEFITDSVVRERMSDFIRDHYIRQVGLPPTAYDFATNSPVADGLLLEALSAYVTEAGRITETRALDVGARLKAFQDDEVANDHGRSYDEYFGYWSPGAFAKDRAAG